MSLLYRTRQISCASIAAAYTCPGDGLRHRWIATTTCTTTSITIPEQSPAHAIAGSSVVQFVGYNSMAIRYVFGGSSSSLTTCQQYFWDNMDHAAFDATGSIKLNAGVSLDHENPNGCRSVSIDVHAVPTDSSLTYVSDTCTITLAVGDVNDRPMWSNWAFSVDVMEDVAPKTILGTQYLQVLDPDADQITYAVSSVECGGGSCDWFEIGSCDGKLRVKSGAAVKYSPGLGAITISVTATDSGGLSATHDENGNVRATATITVTVLNRAEPPVVTGPASFTVSENIQGCDVSAGEPPAQCRLSAVTPDSSTGSLLASDPDGSLLTYTTYTTNDPYFYVRESDGSIFIRQALNYENMPSGLVLRAHVVDAVDGFTVEVSYAVAVADMNDPPFPTCANNIHVPESTAINAAVPGE